MLTFNEFVNRITIPSGSLGISRNNMPQIVSTDVKEFLEWLKKNYGTKSSSNLVAVKTLKMTQNEINTDKVRGMIDGAAESSLKKPIIVSNDNFILDGHHRFVALLNKDKNTKIKIFKVDIKMKQLLELAHTFSKSFTKEIHH